MTCVAYYFAVGANHRSCSTIRLSLVLFFLPNNSEKPIAHSHVTKKSIKFKWLRLQLWITKKSVADRYATKPSLAIRSRVIYWAITSSIVSSLLIMLIRSISRSSSLQTFYLLNHTADIYTKACFISFLFTPTNGFCIHPQRNSIQK